MSKMTCNKLGLATCICLLAASAMAGEKPTATQTTKTAAAAAVPSAWPPETLAGTIMMVDTAVNLLIVKGPSGVPFDLVVTPATRIESGSQRLALKDLNTDTQKSVSVRFIPERAGNIARSITLNG